MRITALLAGFALAFVAAAPALAQEHTAPPAANTYRGPDIVAQRAAMERLAPLVGHWQGTASVHAPTETTVYQSERVEWDMDGLVLVVHGTGYASPDHSGAPVFRAMAVISFDDRRGVYEFRTYNNGYAATATGEFLEDGTFRWSINPGGPVRMRFDIRFDAASWRETGESSYDNGQTWTRTVELDLRRAP